MPDVNDRGFVRSGAPDGPLVVVGPDGLAAASETTLTEILAQLVERYGGGKSAATAQVTATGDTTVLTPSPGTALRVLWVSAINDPDQAVSPRIVVKFGSDEIYRSYAVAHWESFTGPVDEPLVCNLDQDGDVAVTVHYQEV